MLKLRKPLEIFFSMHASCQQKTRFERSSCEPSLSEVVVIHVPADSAAE